MSKKNIGKIKDNVNLGRRDFFGGIVGAAGVAATAIPNIAGAQSATDATAASPTAPGASPSIIGPPSAVLMLNDVGPMPAVEPVYYSGKTGSDYMVDVIKTLDFKYCSLLPGSTFRALHESIINYGNNTMPELITCTNEDVAAAFAHGYAKVANKPMMILVHGVVGLQHASMGIYNAWCDRVPMVVVVGNLLDAAGRALVDANWDHTAQDNAALVRDYIKWDNQPVSNESFALAMVQAKTITTTIPYAPTLIVADEELGESLMPPGPEPFIPPFTENRPPVGDPDSVAAAAKMLVAAEHPVILADRLVRTQKGMDALVELAEALGAPVIDVGARLNMPTRHPLNVSWGGENLLAQADVVLALEPVTLSASLYRYRELPDRTFIPIVKPDVKVISIGSHDLLASANTQDLTRFQPVSLGITGDGEETLPWLVEAVKRATAGGSNISARAARVKTISDAIHAKARQDATYGWNDSPISVPRLCVELGNLIRNDDWALLSSGGLQLGWPFKLWNFTKCYQYQGSSGGGGVGYECGAAPGAALAHRDAGRRLPVATVGDGCLMMNPGGLWTSAHHRIPMLWVVHNNRGWHQEEMHVQRMADRHSRGVSRAVIGTTMTDPNIDFAKIADGMGVWSEGVSDPQKLKASLQRALDVVRNGQPALVDVVSQGR